MRQIHDINNVHVTCIWKSDHKQKYNSDIKWDQLLDNVLELLNFWLLQGILKRAIDN
jgi:hypothetical protein